MTFVVLFDKFRGNSDAVFGLAKTCSCGRREKPEKTVDADYGKSTATTSIRLEDLQGKEPRRQAFIAAIRMPGEVLHRLGPGLVVLTLEILWTGTDISNPPSRGAVGDGKPVAVVFMQVQDHVLEIPTTVVLEA